MAHRAKREGLKADEFKLRISGLESISDFNSGLPWLGFDKKNYIKYAQHKKIINTPAHRSNK
jgi:hypothetical protein